MTKPEFDCRIKLQNKDAARKKSQVPGMAVPTHPYMNIKGCIPNFRTIAPDIMWDYRWMDRVSGLNQKFAVWLKPECLLADYPRHKCRGNTLIPATIGNAPV
jgi:hypothetical protein